MALLLALMVACAGRTRRTPDDTLVVVIGAQIKDIDPRFALTSYDTKLSRLVAPGLTSTDNDEMVPRPELAESIERIDDLTWDVTLREGLRFSDGSPVTSDDVIFTYESTMSEALGSLYKKGFEERIRRIERRSERVARFHLVEPVATLLSDLDFGIISAAAADDDGRYREGKVVGAGAYRVLEKRSDRLLLERNPNYYRSEPPTPKLEVRTVRDVKARALMLVGGSADLVQNGIRVDLVDQVAKRKRVVLESGPSAVLTYLMMHNEDPILRDPRVRRAIAHAIDRETIVRAKFASRAVLATGFLAPGHWGYAAPAAIYDFDLARARALLDEAGYPDPDGPGGAPRFTLTYKTSADAFRLAVARIIAAQLREVDIAIDVRSFEFGTFFSDVKKGNFQLASMQTSDITEPDWYYTFFHSSRIPSPEQPHVHNRWRYRNERIDALTEEGRRSMDREVRQRIYREVQEILGRDLPVIPLWHEDNVAAMNVSVSGFRVLPNARFSGLATAKKSP